MSLDPGVLVHRGNHRGVDLLVHPRHARQHRRSHRQQGIRRLQGIGQEGDRIANVWSGQVHQPAEKALNCYFPMPFGNRARMTVTNEGSQDVEYFFYQVDYELYPDAADIANQGRFHAQWHRENPTKAMPQDGVHPLHPSGDDNYLIVDALGKGQFVGLVLNVQGFSTGWWGEGDDMWFVDGEGYPPSLHGTGLEDYFGNAWGFQDEFNYPFIGYSRKGNDDATGFHTMYRFHVQDPIHFKKSLRGGIEHGHANSRADDFSSTAYWYQTEPHKKFDPLPPVEKRMPNVHWKIDVLEKGLPD